MFGISHIVARIRLVVGLELPSIGTIARRLRLVWIRGICSRDGSIDDRRIRARSTIARWCKLWGEGHTYKKQPQSPLI